MKTISIFNRALCLIMMALCCMVVSGQNSDLPTPPQPGIPKLHDDYSPQVSMMQRYGTYPVDLSTGLVDISIPLYTIQTSQLTLPLGISFHPSGLKANEREGLLGIRWSLTGGGVVTRSIRGYSDFDYRSFNSNIANPEYIPNFHDLYGTQGGNNIYEAESSDLFLSGIYLDGRQYITPGQYRDTEYDIFSYTLPNGKSGKFLLNTLDEKGKYVGVFTMPYEPIKIEYNKNNHQVTITDEDGTVYRFGEGTYFEKNLENIVTTWHLTSVTSADGNDVISMDYICTGQVINGYEKYIRISDDPTDYVSIPNSEATLENGDLGCYFLGELLCSNYRKEEYLSYNFLSNFPYVIKRIKVTSGGQTACEVEFTYENESSLLDAGYLDRLRVKNSSDNTVKDIRFIMIKNVRGVGFLDRLSEINPKTGETVRSHSFEYYNQTSMMGNEELRKNSDWWGYYSAGGGWMKNVTVGAKTPYGIRNIQLGSGDKQPHPTSSMTGMIRSITYPTGGKTTFEYEGNTYGNNNPVGGLRIKQIVNEAVSGKKEIKSYEYGKGWTPHYLQIPNKGYIHNEHLVECYFYYYRNNGTFSWLDYTDRVFQCFFPANYTELNSNIATYQTVTEYEKDGNGNALGKTVYTYDMPNNKTNSVREYYMSANGQEFCAESGFQVLHISPEDFWEKPTLKSKTFYRDERKVQECLYEYQKIMKGEVYDMPIYQYKQFYIWDMQPSNHDNSEHRKLIWLYDSYAGSFAFIHQKYTSGVQRLTKETITEYHDNGGSHTVEKTYSYDSKYLLLQSEAIMDGDTTELYTSYAYPFSPGYYYEDVYEDMIDRNMLNNVLRKNIHSSGEYYCETTEYQAYEGGIYPYRFISSDYGIDVIYHQYNPCGRPVYVTRDDGSKGTVYLWSYCGQYLIAEIHNATYDEVCTALGGEDFVVELNGKTVPYNNDYTAVRNIRNTLPNVKIVTAKYKPLVGMTELTDEKGMTTNYEYDATGRLVRTYMKEGSSEYTLERNEYNYINR